MSGTDPKACEVCGAGGVEVGLPFVFEYTARQVLGLAGVVFAHKACIGRVALPFVPAQVPPGAEGRTSFRAGRLGGS